MGVHGAGVLGAILTYIQGVSENTDTFVLSIVSMFLPVVSWDKDPKIASLMEICGHLARTLQNVRGAHNATCQKAMHFWSCASSFGT